MVKDFRISILNNVKYTYCYQIALISSFDFCSLELVFCQDEIYGSSQPTYVFINLPTIALHTIL